MRQLQPNPITGFLESEGQFVFDSNRKVQILNLAKEIRAKGQWPNVYELCKAVGIDYRTFKAHLDIDENFKAAWDEDIKVSATDQLESKMYEYAQRPSGYMHMITWLRKNDPEHWNPDLKLRINVDSPNVKGLMDGAKQIFDAEIVPNSKELPAIKPQDNQKP
jgi:hypothetical protein